MVMVPLLEVTVMYVLKLSGIKYFTNEEAEA
jgi:hypothetical protein